MKLLYGLTPPRADYPLERIREISGKRMARIQALAPDALVLYDVQDEAPRTEEPRPFPWTRALPPLEWDRSQLQSLTVPRIYYRPVSGDTRETLIAWLSAVGQAGGSAVLVGAASSRQAPSMTLPDAFRLARDQFPTLAVGGIVIPERHGKRGNEHLKLFEKEDLGCRFFISQCIYDLQTTLDFLSDYHYGCLDRDRTPSPVYFTHTPCGSAQTLRFMKWLGIGIPRWLENDLSRSDSILDTSVKVCLDTAARLHDYCAVKGLPHGFNIESVSIRKEEIEASVRLFESLRQRFL